jgi:hypothetical protein
MRPQFTNHFVILLFGSVFFMVHFFVTTQEKGSGNVVILIEWAIRRGLHDIALYLVFVVILFGAYFFRSKQQDE